MSRIERLLLGAAVGLGLVLRVAGLWQNARDMEAASTAMEGIPIDAGAPWDPAQAVRSPQHCTEREHRSGVTWVDPAGNTVWTEWGSAPSEQPLSEAVPFDLTWSAVRIHFCRHAPLALSRADLQGLAIGARPAAGGRRLRVGLYGDEGRLPGTPYRIELLDGESIDPAGRAGEGPTG